MARPDLVLESLIMHCQFSVAAAVLKAAPALLDDTMLLRYARWLCYNDE